MLEAAIDPSPDLEGFIKRFNPTFPVGMVDRLAAASYMQFLPEQRAYVPYMLFIDRKGMIRAQYTGSDPFLVNEQEQDRSIRGEVEKLLAEPAAAPRKRPVKK